MGKVNHSPEYLLNQLGELSYHLNTVSEQEQSYFDKPLQIINSALEFHIGILYKVANVVENDLILEVVAVCNTQHIRPDLSLGAKICLNMENPQKEFINEVQAFRNQNVSSVNVPGWGCDIVGSIYMPENLGRGYLLAGDFFGDESDIQDYEVRTCEIMCNLLSAVLMKTQFEKLANYDGLTGLLNSRTIRDELEKVFYRKKRKKTALGAVVLADIDFFKKVNDQYGHLQGDSVLQEVGGLLDAKIRKHLDVAGRYGGEEFLLIYEDSEKEQIIQIVERLRQSIENHPFKKLATDGKPLADEYLNITMSFGIALFNNPSVENSAQILLQADEALYRSKENGRNQLTLSEN